jgi:hypothetical protein
MFRSSIRFASSGMRLCQFKNESGKICLGAQTQDGKIADVSHVAQDLKTLIGLGPDGKQKIQDAVKG